MLMMIEWIVSEDNEHLPSEKKTIQFTFLAIQFFIKIPIVLGCTYYMFALG